MPRFPRADEAGGLYHALNRGNLRADIFRKDEDFAAFERILGEALERYSVELVAGRDWRWGSLWRWLQNPEPEPQLLSPWPLARLPRWAERVNASLSESELKSVRNSVNRGRPMGDTEWAATTAKRLGMESTMRPRGRPRVQKNHNESTKET